MKTYLLSIELILKDTADLQTNDFIEKAINAVLEAGEFIDSYEFKEVTQ